MEEFKFALLRELVGAEQGQSPYLEMADGFPRRRQVQACRIRTEQELAIAVRLLLAANDGWDYYGLAHQLCQLVHGQGQGFVYEVAEHGKREQPAFNGVRVGTEAEVLGTGRRLVITRLQPMAPLYQ